MPISLHLDDEQISDFRAICRLGESKLRQVVERLKALPVAPLPFSRLLQAMADALQDNPEAAQCIFRQVFPVIGWLRQEQCTVAELMTSVGHALMSEDGWNDDRWPVVEKVLVDLFSVRTIYLSATAVDLSFEHVNLFRGARILTDIRPIFNEEATAIEGSVISHTLRLRFENTEGRHELTFALEESDVKHIEDQCKRALGKAKLALEMMKNRANIPTIISGGIDNE